MTDSGARLDETPGPADRRATDRLRAELIAAVSHDLRTPLSVITGLATALRDGAPVDMRDALDKIAGEAHRLGRTLDNLLVISNVEGRTIRREWIPVEELVGAALARLDVALAGRAVAVDVPGDVLANVDPILGELVLRNLIDNSAKHTPRGTAIEIAARRDGSAVVIEIADRGAGVAADVQRMLAGGVRVGLGLAVCYELVRSYEGTIEAVARDGGGMSIRVRLPDGEPLPELTEQEVIP